MKRGRKVRELDAAGLHELRKELKKLRYTVDMLASLYPGGRTRAYLRALKELQDSFGSLNDAVMAGEALTGPDAPGAADPAAQRAVGWTLGTLAVRTLEDRPEALRALGRLRGDEAVLALTGRGGRPAAGTPARSGVAVGRARPFP